MKRIVLACMLGWSASALAGPPSSSAPAPSASSTLLLLQSQLGPAAQPWRPVGTVMQYGRDFSDGYKSSAMTRYHDQIASRTPVNAVKVCYQNFGGIATTITTEGDGLSTLTIDGSIEINPSITTGNWASNLTTVTLLPLFFSGSRTVALAPGASVCSDPVVYPFAASQTIFERTYVVASGGVTKWPINRNWSIGSFSEGINNNSFTASLSASSTAVTSFTGTPTGINAPVVFPLVPNAIDITCPTITGFAHDDGAGNITGTGVAASSTINYTTGSITLNLTTASAPNACRLYAYGNSGTAAVDATLTAGTGAIIYPTATTGSRITAGAGYGPSTLIGLTQAGTTTQPLGILVLGDSIDQGTGNVTEPGMSWAQYAANGAVGVFTEAQPSETACGASSAINIRRRLSAANGIFDRVIENYGTNDLFSGSITLSALQTCKLALWAQIAAVTPGGYRNIYAATMLPRTVSAASQTPLNSLYGSGSTVRNLYNTWLSTQVGVAIGGVVDVASCLEASAGSGTWGSLSNTFDGTHPSYVGHKAIGTCVGVGGSAASPVFTP